MQAQLEEATFLFVVARFLRDGISGIPHSCSATTWNKSLPGRIRPIAARSKAIMVVCRTYDVQFSAVRIAEPQTKKSPNAKRNQGSPHARYCGGGTSAHRERYRV